jgi:hypothetical protein
MKNVISLEVRILGSNLFLTRVKCSHKKKYSLLKSIQIFKKPSPAALGWFMLLILQIMTLI